MLMTAGQVSVTLVSDDAHLLLSSLLCSSNYTLRSKMDFIVMFGFKLNPEELIMSLEGMRERANLSDR